MTAHAYLEWVDSLHEEDWHALDRYQFYAVTQGTLIAYQMRSVTAWHTAVERILQQIYDTNQPTIERAREEREDYAKRASQEG